MSKKLFLLTSCVLVLALAFTNVAFGDVIERRVAASTDDSEEHVLEGGKIESMTSSDLELGYEGGTSLQTVGIRLLDIQIPQGATITSAWVQFDADDIDNDYHALDVSLVIEGELSPNAVTFSENAGDITARPVTTASVVWDIPQWMVKHGQGPEERTPDISAIIQEIVNQADWAAGNAMVLLFRDNPDKPSAGTREAESFDGTPDAAPLLHIEFEEAAAPTPLVLERTIVDDADDVEEHVTAPPAPGEMESLTSSDLEFGYEHPDGRGDLQMIGLRFIDIAIPNGATITAASVQFQVDEDKGGTEPVNLIVEGELAADAAAFTADAFNVSSRARTTGVVQWSVPNWTNVGDRGPDQATPDISSIIQEIVNQPGWASGNALVLIISDDPANPSSINGSRCAEAGPGDDAAFLHIEYLEPAPPAGANIIWVTETRDNDVDGVQDDQAFVDWLVAEGHTVDVRIDYWVDLDLEPAKVDELNAADLVIVSRSSNSGSYDDGDEPTLWNSVTSPIILMNGYLVRSSRWLWMDTTTINKGDDILLALDPTHPLFEGVTLEMGNMVIFRDNTVGMGITSFVGSIDVGNGTLIAQTLSADNTWIAEWPAGVEFYAGSGQIAGGRRLLFVAGTQEVNADPQGAWDLTADGEQMLRNAISYMLPAAPEAPAGYLYDGDVALYIPEGPGSLDGTWDHENGSDEWDGTGPGEGNPGGAAALVEDGVTFLRIQDTGDPRDYGMGDPGSNRKVYLTHLIDIGLDGATLEARIRIATSAPLDDQHPDGGAGIEPWPAGGIGYHIRDHGKGMFGIAEAGLGIISFSLAKAGEPGFEDVTTDVLVMNNLVGDVPSADVDTGDAALASNMIAVNDATQWHTFTIDIAAGGAGTHLVSVSVDGGPAEQFEVTTGDDPASDASHIAIGSSGTGGVTAFDLDYISVQ